jgi:GNAT superfamily N-acetyltransferase
VTPEAYEPWLDDVHAHRVWPHPSTWVFAAYEGSVIVGLAGIEIRTGYAVLKGAYVPPDHRGRGVWSFLFCQRIALLWEMGILHARATVRPMVLDAYLHRGAKAGRHYPREGSTNVTLKVRDAMERCR